MQFSEATRIMLRDPLGVAGQVWVLFMLVIAVFGPSLAPYDPQQMIRIPGSSLAANQPPSHLFPFGTTDLGRDVFSQVVLGTKTAVVTGFSAALMALVIGTLYGTISGYFKGLVDDLMMRALEVAQTIPFEPLAILLLSIAPRNEWTVTLAIVMVFWRHPSRVIRNQVLSLRERGFVRAAQASGAGHPHILARHIIPNVLPIAFVYIPVAFGNALLAEAAISFLGFGNPNDTSWGQVLRNAFTAGAVTTAWWWLLAPGLAIMLTTAAAFFSTRPFEVILNPRMRKT
jgi:peptide/nickel transport system permease protein